MIGIHWEERSGEYRLRKRGMVGITWKRGVVGIDCGREEWWVYTREERSNRYKLGKRGVVSTNWGREGW